MVSSRQQLRQRLRQQLRGTRRALSPAQQHRAAHRLAHQLSRLATLSTWRHVALYWPDDGEIDPSVFARLLKRRGVRLYLPVLAPRKNDFHLRFLAAPTQAYRQAHRQQLRQQFWPAKRNRYGLREPLSRHTIRPEKLDALLMPLVGFDASGQRLGMGGGFYDRLLARLGSSVRRPLLIGLAHQSQGVEALPTEPWDKPVDMIVTDAGHLRR
ncbi:MAG: 5-formyltetrahydrofolate cyclo-ligase [Paraperlucidibaca sp.]